MTKALSPVRNAIVTIQNGKPMCSSRDVAAMFGKHHNHVLRSIDALLEDAPITASNFGLSGYKDSTGRTLRAFNMTKDGFVLLAMGFTGKEALRFKLAYIARFNEMEEQLRTPGRRQPRRMTTTGTP